MDDAPRGRKSGEHAAAECVRPSLAALPGATAVAPDERALRPLAVLLVADDRAVRAEVMSYLTTEGFAVRAVAGPDEALRLVGGSWFPDAVVVDLLVPTLDAYTIGRAMRSTFTVPVLLVVAGSERGPGGDTDGVLPKPIALPRLRGWLGNVLRLADPAAAPGADTVAVAGLVAHPQSCRAVLDGRDLALSADETALIARLVASPGRAVPRVALLAALRGVDRDADPRLVDVHMVRLMVMVGDGASVRICRAGEVDGYVLVAGGPLAPPRSLPEVGRPAP